MTNEAGIAARLRASTLRREAQFAATPDQRESLLKAAEKWMELAEGMERLAADDCGPNTPKTGRG